MVDAVYEEREVLYMDRTSCGECGRYVFLGAFVNQIMAQAYHVATEHGVMPGYEQMVVIHNNLARYAAAPLQAGD